MSILGIIEEALAENEYYSKFDLTPKDLARGYLIHQEYNKAEYEYEDGYNRELNEQFEKAFGDWNFRSPDGVEYANWHTLSETVEGWIIKAVKAEIAKAS